MITTRGIYLDINDSVYFYKVGRYKFYFSSRGYREKFIRKVENFMKEERAKFEIKYKTILTDNLFFAFVLYSRIEKRGFRVEAPEDKGKITSLPFVGLKMI